jgi:hypothetical protein
MLDYYRLPPWYGDEAIFTFKSFVSPALEIDLTVCLIGFGYGLDGTGKSLLETESGRRSLSPLYFWVYNPPEIIIIISCCCYAAGLTIYSVRRDSGKRTRKQRSTRRQGSVISSSSLYKKTKLAEQQQLKRKITSSARFSPVVLIFIFRFFLIEILR